MNYKNIQDSVYSNKLQKNFNVTDIGKEIILMSEEFGELCQSYLIKNDVDMIDAVGDLQVYCLGLCSMLNLSADETKSSVSKSSSIEQTIIRIGGELGMIAKAYKKSNKQQANYIDKKDVFAHHTGQLMSYLSEVFGLLDVDEYDILNRIVANNVSRTHSGMI